MSRRHSATAAALAACWLLATPWGSPRAASAQGSREVDIYLSALTRANVPVPDLKPDDVLIHENGMRREVLRLRRATDPIDLAILVDNSQAASSMMLDMRRGLDAFIGRMQVVAHIALVAYGERPTVMTEYTRDPAALKQGVGRLFPIRGAGAYFGEAVREVCRGLEKREAERAGIVAISAGGREFSNQSVDQLLEDLRGAGAALHVITIGTGSFPSSEEARNRDALIDRGPAQSGGRRENVLDAMGVPDALDRLATELLGQYRVTYARPES